MTLTKKEKVVRSNTRILPDQATYIKKLSKETGHSEGEVFREMLQYYIDNHQ
jgi:hypothetical protein